MPVGDRQESVNTTKGAGAQGQALNHNRVQWHSLRRCGGGLCTATIERWKRLQWVVTPLHWGPRDAAMQALKELPTWPVHFAR